MIEHIDYLINLVGGTSNALSIFGILISVFYAFYLYFKTFYRLVYSTERICKKGREIKNWKDEENEYTTRVLIYNNGRKTLYSADIKKLKISSSNDILSAKILLETPNVKIDTDKRNVKLKIKHLDASNFFVVEIEHKGFVEVQGRVSETGEILPTEPLSWKIFNFIFLIYLFYEMGLIMLNLESLISKTNSNINFTYLLNFLLIIASILIVRFVHSILYIPDSITAKYIGVKDKFNIEFKNNF